MFARALLGLALALGLVGWLPATARADWASQQAQQAQLASAEAATQSYVLLAQTLQANALAAQQVLEYGRPAGADPFASRSSWLDLRISRAGSAGTTSSRLITAPRAPAIVRTGVRFAPNSGRVGGLGRQISGGAPSLSLHGISSGASGAGSVSFGGLHEGSESFSFSRPQ